MTRQWKDTNDEEIIDSIRAILSKAGYEGKVITQVEWATLSKSYPLPSITFIRRRFDMALQPFLYNVIWKTVPPSITAEEMVDTLYRHANGEYVKLHDWQGPIPAYRYTRQFGSWLQACRQAGLRNVPDHWTRERILDKMREATQEMNRSLTREEWVGPPSVSHIEKVFGGWANAWREMGYDLPMSRKPRSISDEQILDTVKAVHGQMGYVSVAWWEKNIHKPSAALLRARFGSWENVWEQAMEMRNKGELIHQETVQLTQIMMNTMKQLGHYVTPKTWREKNLQPSVEWIYNHYEKWKNAWELAGIQSVLSEFPNPERYPYAFYGASEKVQHILMARYEGQKMKEIATQQGVTQQYVSLVCRQFLDDIKE